MRAPAEHDRRWGSDSFPSRGIAFGGGVSPGGTTDSEEFVEVTIDLQDDDTIILRSVEPATIADILEANGKGKGALAEPSGTVTPLSLSRSPTIRRSSSSKIRQFSQELKAEAVAKARQFSQELKAELRRFSWGHGYASRVLSASTSSSAGGGIDSALAARALRRQKAQLDRTKSGAQKALRGLRFISNNNKNRNGVDVWDEVQANFDKLATDGYLRRADFAQCIGMRDSKEFALELFDALGRRRSLKVDKISKEELYEFWSQITDQSFDSRLQIFFDIQERRWSDHRRGGKRDNNVECIGEQAFEIERTS